MSVYIGVDPGKKGGFAVIYEDDGQQKAETVAWDEMLFVYWCQSWKGVADARGERIVACVERVGAMHGQGVTSMFTFGQGFGYILGVLAALGIGVQLVPPGTWKKEFSLIGKDKTASVKACKRLFPGVSLLPTEKCRKDSDGMAEALLMAEYGRRKF